MVFDVCCLFCAGALFFSAAIVNECVFLLFFCVVVSIKKNENQILQFNFFAAP